MSTSTFNLKSKLLSNTPSHNYNYTSHYIILFFHFFNPFCFFLLAQFIFIQRAVKKNLLNLLFMDSDFWVSRLAAAKRQFFNHHSHHLNAHLDRLIIDEMDDDDDDDEEEEDDMAYPCPYCYVEFDLIPLFHHIRQEHRDDNAETICTLCCDKISGDMLRHMTTEHESEFKMAIQQSRSRIMANPRSEERSLFGRDLREAHLKSLLAGRGEPSTSGVSDPLMSSLVSKYPAPAAEDFSKLVISCAEDSSKTVEPPQQMWQSSIDPSLSSEEREERTRQAAGKAAFVQDLLFSAMFKD